MFRNFLLSCLSNIASYTGAVRRMASLLERIPQPELNDERVRAGSRDVPESRPQGGVDCKLRVVEGIIELRPKLHGLWSVRR